MTKLFVGWRAGRRSLAWRLLAVSSLLAFLLPAPGAVAAAADLDAATKEVREATAALTERIEQMPRQAQLEVGTEIRFLVRAIESELLGLERLPVAPADPQLNRELMFLADLTRVVAAELEAIPSRGTDRQRERLRDLTLAATGSVQRAGAIADGWDDLTQSMVVEVEPATDGATIRMIDRTTHDAIRFGALALFLLGLLACGLRLLALGEVDLSIRDLIKQSPGFSLGGGVVILLFLATSLTVTLKPTTVAGLAERTDRAKGADACDHLAAQREQLIEARALGHDGLGDAVKDRMRPVAQDCLDLDSQVAAVEAVEWLAASLDPLAPAPRSTASIRSPGPDAIDREIERLIGTVQSLRSVTDEASEVAALPTDDADVAGSGGPVEAFTEEEETPRGRQVVTTARVNYRAGPGTGERRLGTLPEGAVAVLLSEDDDWSHVQLEDGRSVYVASEYIRTAAN